MNTNVANVQGLPKQSAIIGLSLVLGCIFVELMTLLLGDSRAAIVLLDRSSESFEYTSSFPYPFTIQNFMHLVFFFGLGELFTRWRVAIREKHFLDQKYLPEDNETVLQSMDLGPIWRKVAGTFDTEHGFLPYLIDSCILQFQASRSTDQTVSVLNSNLELIAHRVDLRYSMLRYIVWVIPTIGFIGTVVGIASALTGVDPEHPDLQMLTGKLGVAFNTTLVALVFSAILVFLLQVVQSKEEQSVNLAGSYCLRNLINRLYSGSV